MSVILRNLMWNVSFPPKVTMVDAGHPIRGSWGDTRALHVAMEDDVRIKASLTGCEDITTLHSV